MHNKAVWSTPKNAAAEAITSTMNNTSGSTQRHRPILMICFTNHALDQFLESCIQTCGLAPGEVIRVGGRSKNENLDEYLLGNVKQALRTQQRRGVGKSTDCHVRYGIRDESNRLRRLQQEVDFFNGLLRVLFNGQSVLNFKTMAAHMRDEHKQQFEEHFLTNRTYSNMGK